jgi:hypothetical protein
MTPATKSSLAIPELASRGTAGAPVWARLFVPSVSDLLFVVLAYRLTLSRILLGDPDIGWHIRNGQHILATHSIPRVDYFSTTMAGQPWYAWEWLYDLMISGVHSLAGLSGVVLFSATVAALVIVLVFRLTLKSSGNLLVALALTGLTLLAGSIHLLARPHLLSWLLTLAWFQMLDAFHRGGSRHLFLLPALMLLWVNLHGGFLLGLALLGIFLAADLATAIGSSSENFRADARHRARHLGLIFLLCLAATLCTPYGYHLHAHVARYLGNKFLMDNIQEFLAPNFHMLQMKGFLVLLLVVMVALARQGRKARLPGLLLIFFSLWIGLIAVRNIPISCILLSLVIAPLLGAALDDVSSKPELAGWVRRMAASVNGYSSRMAAIEQRFRGHLLATIALLVLLAGVVAVGRSPQRGIQFDPKRMPAQAAEFMAAHNIRDHFFSPDFWGGYLIYRLYPDVHVMLDDRHDLYGEVFLRGCLKAAHFEYGWRDVLDRNGVKWVVVPPDLPLANGLKLAQDWKVIYDDGSAIIFARTIPSIAQ